MKPPTFIECSVCGREFGSKSIIIHEPQCLQKLRKTEILQQENNETAPGTNKKSRRKKKLVQRNRESETRGMGTTTTTSKFQSAAMPFDNDHSSGGGSNSSTSFVIMTTSATTSSIMRNTTEKLNLPKIQTSMKTTHRPSTAILDKPRILNPEYIQYDMSLTRIDFTGQSSPSHTIHSTISSGGHSIKSNPLVASVGSGSGSAGGIDENQNRSRTLVRQNTQILDNHHRTEFILPTVDGPTERDRDRLSQIHSTGTNNMSKQSTKHHQRTPDASSNNSKLLPCTNTFTVDSILGDPGKKAGEDRGGGGGRMMMNIVGETIFPRDSDPGPDPDSESNLYPLVPLILPPPSICKAKSPPIESLFSAPNFHLSKLSQCDLEKPLPTCFHLEKIEKMPTPHNRPNADSNKNNHQPNLSSQQQQYKDDVVTPTTSATRTILCCHLPPPPTTTPPQPAATTTTTAAPQIKTPPDNNSQQYEYEPAHKNVNANTNFSNYNYRYNESNSESILKLPKDQIKTQTETKGEDEDENEHEHEHENKRESFKQALTAATAAINTTKLNKNNNDNGNDHCNHLSNTCHPIASHNASNQSEYGQVFNQLKEPTDTTADEVQGGQENEQHLQLEQVSKEVLVLKNVRESRVSFLKSQDGLAELNSSNQYFTSDDQNQRRQEQTQLPYQPNWIGTPFMANHNTYYSVPQLQKGQEKSRIHETGGDSECVCCRETRVSTEPTETNRTTTIKDGQLSTSTETTSNSSSNSPREGSYPSVISLIEELQEISNRKIVSRVKLCTNSNTNAEHQNSSYSRLLSSSRTLRSRSSRSRSQSRSRSRSRSISKCKCNLNKSNSNSSLTHEKEVKKEEKSESHSSLANYPTYCFPAEVITTTTSEIQSGHTVKSRSKVRGGNVSGASDVENVEDHDNSLPKNNQEFSARISLHQKCSDYPDDSFEELSTESASQSQSDDPYSQNEESFISTSRISSGCSWVRNSSRRLKLHSELKSTVSGSDADDEACDSPEISRKIARTFTNHDNNNSSNPARLRLSQRRKSSCTFSNTVIKTEMYSTNKKKSSVNVLQEESEQDDDEEEIEAQEEEEEKRSTDEVLKFKLVAGMDRGFPDDDNDFENLLSQKLIHVTDHSRGLKKPKTKTNLKCGASKSINDLIKSPISHSYSLPRTRANPHINDQQQQHQYQRSGSPCDSNPSIFQEQSDLQITSNVRDSSDCPLNNNTNDHHHHHNLKCGMKSEQAFQEHSYGENRMDRERIRERRPFLTHSRPTETEVEDTVTIWEGSHIIQRNRRPGENSMELLTNQESLPPRPQTRRHSRTAEDQRNSNLITNNNQDDNENENEQGTNNESNNHNTRRREDNNTNNSLNQNSSSNSNSKYMKTLPVKVKTHDNKKIQNLISNVCRLHEMQKDKKIKRVINNNNNNERPKTSPACIEPMMMRDKNERVGSRGIMNGRININGKNTARPASAINHCTRPSTCIPMTSQQSSKIGNNKKDQSSKEKSKIPRSKRSMSKSATGNNHHQHHKNNFSRELSGKKQCENHNNNNHHSATAHTNTNKMTQRPATANATPTFNYVQANANAFKNNSFNFHPFINISRPRTETVKTALIRRNSNLFHKHLSTFYHDDFQDTNANQIPITANITSSSVKSRPLTLAKSPGLSELQKYRNQQQEQKRPKSPSPSIFSSYSTDEEPLELLYSFKSKAKSQLKRKKSPIGLCTPLDMIKLDKASLYAQIELYRRRALAQRAEKTRQPSLATVKERSKKFNINHNPLKKDKGTETGNYLSSGSNSTPRSGAGTPSPSSLKKSSFSTSKKRLLTAKKVLRELTDKVRRDQELQYLKQLQEQKSLDKSYSSSYQKPFKLIDINRIKSPLKLRVKTKTKKLKLLPIPIERKIKKTEIPVPMSKRVQFSSPVHNMNVNNSNNNNNNNSINSTIRNHTNSNSNSTPIPISVRHKVIRKQKVPPEKQSQTNSPTGNRKRSSTSTSTQVDRGSRKSHSAGPEKQGQKLRITIQAAKDRQGKLKLTLRGGKARGYSSDHEHDDNDNNSPETTPTPRRTMTAPPIPNITLADLDKEEVSPCQGSCHPGRESQQNQEKRDQETHRRKEIRDTLERLEQNRDRLRGKDFEKRKREGGSGGGGGGKKDDHTSIASMAMPQKDEGEDDKMLNVKIIVRRKDPDGSLPAIENVVHAFSTKWSYLIVDEQPLTSTSPNPFLASHQSRPKTKKQDENFYALKITTSNQSTIDSLPSEEALNRFLTCYICGKSINAKEYHDHEKECVNEVNRKNGLVQEAEDKIILPPKPQGTITIKHWNEFAYEALKDKYVKCPYCGMEYFPDREGESERHKNQCNVTKKSANSKVVGVRDGGTYGPIDLHIAEESMGWAVPTIRDLHRGKFHCAAQRAETFTGGRYKAYRKPKTGSQSVY